MNTNNPLTKQYSGTEIRYDEVDDLWHYEIGGRERTKPTLSQAKQDIDRPRPKKRVSDFERVKVYHRGYNNQFEEIEATSISNSSWRGESCWTIDKDKDRRIHRVSELFPVNERNTALVKRWEALIKESDKLRESAAKVASEMQPLKLPPAEKDNE